MKTVMFRTLLVAGLLTGFGSVAVAQEVSVPGIEKFSAADVSHVRLLLSGYHGLPARDALVATPNAFEIVNALTNDDNKLVRDHALEAMGRFWPSGDVFLTYANVLADRATPDGTRHRVMLLAAEVFGHRAVPMIRPYLAVDDLQLRLTAIDALGRVRTDESVAILEQHAAHETNAVALRHLEKATRLLR